MNRPEIEPDMQKCPQCGHEFDVSDMEVATVGSALLGPSLPHAQCPECKKCIGCSGGSAIYIEGTALIPQTPFARIQL